MGEGGEEGAGQAKEYHSQEQEGAGVHPPAPHLLLLLLSQGAGGWISQPRQQVVSERQQERIAVCPEGEQSSTQAQGEHWQPGEEDGLVKDCFLSPRERMSAEDILQGRAGGEVEEQKQGQELQVEQQEQEVPQLLGGTGLQGWRVWWIGMGDRPAAWAAGQGRRHRKLSW